MKNKDMQVNVHHVTRVEGHGNIELDVKEGQIKKIEWQVPEAPRFFEAMVLGRSWKYLAPITSRICGICSIGHTTASLKATEAAFGVKLSEQSELLRRLAVHAENIQSHVLHVGYLVAPDLFGVGSVFPLLDTHLEEVKKIIALHRFANEFSDLICGRTIHPTSMCVGGFSKLPREVELEKMKDRIENKMIPVLKEVAELVLANADKLPNFTRETEYIGLVSEQEYVLYDGKIGSTDTGIHEVADYQEIANEYVVSQSTAKYAKHARKSYMVGALARFNLNSDKLSPLASKVAEMFGLEAVCYNPFMNNVAQLVEVAHSFEDSVRIIDELLSAGIKEEEIIVKPKEGRGISGVEVPRGILFHDYTYDSNGKCVKANCVIPTNQNHGNIQYDMEELVPGILDKSQDEVRLTLEMLVRAYDPCISCSTHYLDVKFK